MTTTYLSLIFPLMLVYGAINDFMSYRIPNWLNLAIAGTMPLVALVAGMPLDLLGFHLATGALVLVVGFGIFAMGWAGGGDAKMVAAAALWVGWEQLLPFLILVSLTGGVLALGMKFWQMVQIHQEVRNGPWLKEVFSRQLDLPYGMAIAAGGLLVFPHTWWMSSLG